MSSVVRFGIIGCNTTARKLSRAISLVPDTQIVAVGASSLDEANQFITSNKLPDKVIALGTFPAVIDEQSVDAVFVSLIPQARTFAIDAARKGKHVLLETPSALLDTEELDAILTACRDNRVQFMDSTMWLHHPRTEKMKKFIMHEYLFGKIKKVDSIYTARLVQDDTDPAVGVPGDAGWYCISSILWAHSYVLPQKIQALNSTLHTFGDILCCGAKLVWSDEHIATLHYSNTTHLSMQMSVIGTEGSLFVTDFVIPYEEGKASFLPVSRAEFTEMLTGWNRVPRIDEVNTPLPQDALMVLEFARLVCSIRDEGGEPEMTWPDIARKTQLVFDALKNSVDDGCITVAIRG